MAVVATGLAVGAGQLASGGSSSPATTSTAAADLTPQAAATKPSSTPAPTTSAKTTAAPEAPTESTPIGDAARSDVLSRSGDRRVVAGGSADESADPTKVDLLSLGSGNAMAKTENMSDADPRTVAQALLGQYGWSQDQFGCLDSLWTRESGWNPYADNPSSSAYGIPQALPGSKMASAGADWATNPATQIKWGLSYIAERYGSPCSAWGHSQATGFY